MRRSRAASAVQRGFTLVEMVVALALGIALTGVVLKVQAGAAQAARVTQASAQMHEDGQAALAFLAQQIRQLGYNPPPAGAAAAADLQAGERTLFACDSGFVKNDADAAGLQCASGAPGRGAIALAYVADTFNTLKTSKGEPADCIGNALAAIPSASGSYRVAQPRLFIDDDANLACLDHGLNRSQPLVQNVEGLWLTFGVRRADAVPPYVAAGYLAPRDMGADDWPRAVVVRACVLMRSEKPVLASADGGSYADCEGQPQRMADGRLRRAYATTLLLPNRAGAGT